MKKKILKKLNSLKPYLKTFVTAISVTVFAMLLFAGIMSVVIKTMYG